MSKRDRDEEDDENEGSDEDVEPEEPMAQQAAVAPRRGPARRGRETYTGAFRMLANHDLDGFLNCWLIRRDFAPAFYLLGSFGQGHRESTVTNFWHLHFTGALYYRKLTVSRNQGTCCACALRRNLKYCFYLRDAVPADEFFDAVDDQEDGGIVLLGLMGTHCFEIKFRALMRLADVCLDLLANLDRQDFNTYAPIAFAAALDRVRIAPALMKQVYD